MKATILYDISEEIVNKCSEITGIQVTKENPEDADIQIILNKFVPTEKLRMVQTVSAGVDHLNFKDLNTHITLCSNAGAFSDPVAEHAFAMILAHEKRICQFSSETRNGIYQKAIVGTLNGATFGVLGHGGIGRSAARIAKGLRMRVVAYTRTIRNDENVDEFVKSAEEVVSASDVLLIALPKTQKTTGIVNSELLSHFKGSLIVNVARADIVDEKDMKEYLAGNPEVYYLSDVWWNEPDVNFPLPENSMLTPHVGGISRESADNAFLLACTNVRRYLEGKQENQVDTTEYVK